MLGERPYDLGDRRREVGDNTLASWHDPPVGIDLHEAPRDRALAYLVAELDAERRGALPFVSVRCDEAEDREHQAVELSGVDQAGPFAVEHSLAESYNMQIPSSLAVLAMFPNGGPELPEIEHAGHYRILVGAGALRTVRAKDRQVVASSITTWTREHISQVPWPHVPGQPTFVRGRIPLLRSAIGLERWIDHVEMVGPLRHVVPVTQGRPSDLEDRRRLRMAVLLDNKLPKLLAAAGSGRSILVIEYADYVTAAPALISKAMKAASIGRVSPSVTYLFTTAYGPPLVWVLHENGAWWHELQPPSMRLSDEAARIINAYS